MEMPFVNTLVIASVSFKLTQKEKIGIFKFNQCETDFRNLWDKVGQGKI